VTGKPKKESDSRPVLWEIGKDARKNRETRKREVKKAEKKLEIEATLQWMNTGERIEIDGCFGSREKVHRWWLFL
jgi:hypothetical protein